MRTENITKRKRGKARKKKNHIYEYNLNTRDDKPKNFLKTMELVPI